MSLMIWFRKHNRKIMAFVVIALMIVFTIEPLMNYLSSFRSGGSRHVANYDKGKKINAQDIESANHQIEILKTIGIESILRPEDPRLASTQDLRIILLGELIFSERSNAVETLARIRQIVNKENYKVSDKQINEIYSKQYPASIYWILLTNEAHQAGVQTPADQTRTQLQMLIPRLHRGATYEQVIDVIQKRNRVSESEIIDSFSNLTSIIEYCRAVTSTQNRSLQQIANETVFQQETIDVNYVSIEARDFINDSFKPAEEKILEQFNVYKDNFPEDISESNPYGFGYKIPEGVSFEYIAVRLNDVASTVKPLTQEEAEDYYQQHLQAFTRMVPADPNDPNSKPVPKTRSYAEVASFITKNLYQQRVDSKAEQIINEAKSKTEINVSAVEAEQGKFSDEQFKKAAVDYAKVAAELNEKYNIKLYSGKTGFLTASDMQQDSNLNVLYVGGGGVAETSLIRAAFSIEQLKTSNLGPIDAKVPKLYENIGPLKDARELSGDFKGTNMMLVRIVDARKAAVPNNIDEKLDKTSVRFNGQPNSKDVNTPRQFVIEDLKLLNAMAKTKTVADEFIAAAGNADWNSTIDKFNKSYAKNKNDVNEFSRDHKIFRMSKKNGLRRISNSYLENVRIRNQGNPLGRLNIARIELESFLLKQIYNLVPPDNNTLPKPAVMEFKTGMSYYCLENVTINRLFQEQFDMMKASEVIRSEFADGQSLAFVQYKPMDIVKRMKFVQLQERTEAPPQEEPNSNAADNNRPEK